MGPRRQRAEAVTKLTDAFTRQFGEKAREAVEANVEAHLGSSKGQISREHIDAIEKGIMSTMRQQRGSKKSFGFSQSAPLLPTASSLGASTQAATVTALPPATPVRPTPKLPIGTSNPATMSRSASTGGLTAGTKLKPRRPAPFGMSVTGGDQFENESARSGVKVNPRYPVPLPPKLKPLDHWDLIVAFDSRKYQTEERHLMEAGHAAAKKKFKDVLDGQMVEIQEMRDNEARGQEEEKLMMTAQIEENKRYRQEEHDIIRRKREEQGRINESMLGELGKFKRKEEERKRRECEDMTRWLESEKNQKEEDNRNQKIEYARKCEAALKNLEEFREARAEKKRQDDANESRLMKLRDQMADEAEAKKQKALQDRKDHIEKIAKTMGAAVAERDAKDQADLEAKIKRIQEESNRRSMEDAKARQDAHNAKVKEMVEMLEWQAEEKRKREAKDTSDGQTQLAMFKKQCEDADREEKAKQERRRKAREDLDMHLISQQRINAGVHPHHVMMTPRNKKTELGYNKAIYEQMSKEGFMSDAVTGFFANPGKDHHPEGKLTAFPTIPRYTEEIHPFELEQPDV